MARTLYQNSKYNTNTMDDDNDPSTWILVDYSEESKTPATTSNITIQESDHESDSSISIISEFPNESFSDEDTLICTSNENVKVITKILLKNEEIVIPTEGKQCIIEERENENNQINNDDTPSTSDISGKQWTFVDDKSKLLDTKEKTFFLDCSQEPVLEISDIDTESTSSGPECKALIEQESRLMSIDQFSLSRNGMFILFLFLCFSIVLKFYLDHTDIDIDHYPTNPFLDNIPTTDKDIIKSCIQKQKAKTTADGFLERCVIRHLNNKKKDIMKHIKLYLEIHEWMLEKKIKEKENKMFKRWSKKIYNENLKQEHLKTKKQNKHEDKYSETKKTKRKYLYVNNTNSSQFNKTQANEKLKNKRLTEKVLFDKEKKCKKHFKKKRKNDEAKLRNFFSKVLLKNVKHKETVVEWYVKFNPIENDIEIINISHLSNTDFVLIRNNNKTSNGLWYFNLYGLFRPSIRHKNSLRYMPDNAKWYFDYMTARDEYRHLYSSIYEF